MAINRAIGVGLAMGIAFAGLIGALGGNFGTWLAVGLVLGVAGGAGASNFIRKRPPHTDARDG